MGNNTQRIFSIEELKEFNGKDGRPAYVCYKGLIYDVSSSHHWLNGTHMDRHFSGFDLTEILENAPHDADRLLKFPVVGELSKKLTLKPTLADRIQRLHLHGILVHFPIAYTLIVFLLALVYILTGNIFWEKASYLMLALSLLAIPPTMVFGFFSWKVTYKGKMTKNILRKIVLSSILFVVIIVSFLWQSVDPEVLMAESSLRYLYLALLFSLIPIVTILGHAGGRIANP